MSNTRNLLELFNNKVFRIPDYQRGYSWEDKQLSELWDDLDEINNEMKPHYTGTIFLEESKPLAEEEWLTSKFFNIIDGQQRLTTIIILIFEFLKQTDNGYCDMSKNELYDLFIAKKSLSKIAEVYKFSYQATNQNYNYLLKEIYEKEKTVIEMDRENFYTHNLSYAKDFFKKKIMELDNNQKEILFKKIISCLIFDERIIEKDLDVQAVFETMNNRGKPLTILEKLKNRLIYLNERLDHHKDDKKVLRKKINDVWGIVYSSLAKNPDDVLDEDVFLSAHLSLYKKPQQGNVFSEKSAEEKLFQMFCNKPEKYNEETLNYEKINDYITSLSDLALVWHEIHNNSDLRRNILLLNGSKEVKILLSALMLRKLNMSELNTILMLIENVFFRNSIPGMWILDIEYHSAEKARDIYNGENLSDFITFLEDKNKSPINQQSVVDGFKGLFTYVTGNKGFHRWWGLKYFLFQYEEFLKTKFKETIERMPISVFYDTQIEHIMPQKPWEFWNNETEEYLSKFSDERKDHALKVLLNSLGNLTILLHKNQPLGNKSWEYKREWFNTGSYNEYEISKNDYWDFSAIRKRGENMLEFLCNKINKDFKLEEELVKQILFNTDYIIKRVYE